MLWLLQDLRLPEAAPRQHQVRRHDDPAGAVVSELLSISIHRVVCERELGALASDSNGLRSTSAIDNADHVAFSGATKRLLSH